MSRELADEREYAHKSLVLNLPGSCLRPGGKEETGHLGPSLPLLCNHSPFSYLSVYLVNFNS